MDKFGYWWCGVSRIAVCHCHYLCEVGDWSRDYGKSQGDDLGWEANLTFAATLDNTGAGAKVS